MPELAVEPLVVVSFDSFELVLERSTCKELPRPVVGSFLKLRFQDSEAEIQESEYQHLKKLKLKKTTECEKVEEK